MATSRSFSNTFIYGFNGVDERENLWQSLKDLSGDIDKL